MIFPYFLSSASICLVSQFGLRRCETRDRDAVGRARDVVEPDLTTEMDRGRVSAMLAANAELDTGTRRAAALGGDADHLADPLPVDADERVALENSGFLVARQKTRRIVA